MLAEAQPETWNREQETQRTHTKKHGPSRLGCADGTAWKYQFKLLGEIQCCVVHVAKVFISVFGDSTAVGGAGSICRWIRRHGFGVSFADRSIGVFSIATK